jgi:hypothetical protein
MLYSYRLGPKTVVDYWCGCPDALAFGVWLLVLGFQLHSKREAQLREAPTAAKKAKKLRGLFAVGAEGNAPYGLSHLGPALPGGLPRTSLAGSSGATRRSGSG